MSAPSTPDEPGDLRSALNWFHTWFGLFLGGLMFVIFWTGTLAVFDREIDRWMMPDTRLSEAQPLKVDPLLPLVRKLAPDAVQWRIMLPDERTPVLELQASLSDGTYVSRMVDPATLRVLPDQGTYGGTEFFYPYHFRLNIGAVGLFICAFAAVVMLALCISGVIVHRKIFADFFTLRIVRKPQRTTLDLHNLTGVLTLPFLLMISFTGVAIFTYTYLPSAQSLLFSRDPSALAGGYFSRDAAGRPGGKLVSLDALLDRAATHWETERPRYVQVIHADDANAYIEIRPPSSRTISKSTAAIWYDAASGKLLGISPATGTRKFYDFIYGIHLIQFDHWALRWLYFLSGLAGSILIATGMLFWIQSRRKRHAKMGKRGVRLAEATSIAFTTGLLLASLGFMIVNRILPSGLAGRADVEVQMFH
ncbi:MAG: PepSY domain-containing protein, partial [Proteobacteria bacterium]